MGRQPNSGAQSLIMQVARWSEDSAGSCQDFLIDRKQYKEAWLDSMSGRGIPVMYLDHIYKEEGDSRGNKG